MDKNNQVRQKAKCSQCGIVVSEKELMKDPVSGELKCPTCLMN